MSAAEGDHGWIFANAVVLVILLLEYLSQRLVILRLRDDFLLNQSELERIHLLLQRGLLRCAIL